MKILRWWLHWPRARWHCRKAIHTGALHGCGYHNETATIQRILDETHGFNLPPGTYRISKSLKA